MNYYKAREIQRNGEPTGKWRFTKRNDDHVWAVGYCREEEHEHDTPEEACDCYRQYQLDNARETTFSAYRECEVDGCEELSNKGMDIDGNTPILCEKHLDKETAKQFLNWENTMQITASW